MFQEDMEKLAWKIGIHVLSKIYQEFRQMLSNHTYRQIGPQHSGAVSTYPFARKARCSFYIYIYIHTYIYIYMPVMKRTERNWYEQGFVMPRHTIGQPLRCPTKCGNGKWEVPDFATMLFRDRLMGSSVGYDFDREPSQQKWLVYINRQLMMSTKGCRSKKDMPIGRAQQREARTREA